MATPEQLEQYALERAQGMSHRHPLMALIYEVVADVMHHGAQLDAELRRVEAAFEDDNTEEEVA